MIPEPVESNRSGESDAPDPPDQLADGNGTEGSRPEGDGAPGAPGVPTAADRAHAGADELALLAAFDRLSPQGSLRWGFDDAMRRIVHPENDVAIPRWPGLPADLWERGRSARIGRRFVGDVAGVMAELLATDAREAAAAASAGVNVATWDALRYLAARVEALEAATDPVRLEAAELPLDPPDLGAEAPLIGSLIGPPDPDRAVVVGECGDGALPRWLRQSGWRVESVEPRAASAWAGFAADGDGAGEPPAGEPPRGESPAGEQLTGDRPAGTIVMAELLDHLRTVPPDSRAGAVLAGSVDRLGLAAKVELLDEAARVTRPGGVVVVLAADQSAWDAALEPPARDLAPGRPLHPETWSLLFRRSGLVAVESHRTGSGAFHAVVGRIGP